MHYVRRPTQGLAGTITAPLCQEDAKITFSANVFSFLEELGGEDDVGVEDFDADEAVVLPIEGDEGFDTGGRRGPEGGPRRA